MGVQRDGGTLSGRGVARGAADDLLAVIGVDPGRAGAFALLRVRGAVVSLAAVADMPLCRQRLDLPWNLDLGEVVALFAGMAADIGEPGRIVCAIESVGAAPGQGRVSAFNFGWGAGVIAGVAVARGLSPVFLRPQEWQRLAGRPAGADKTWSRERAAVLFGDPGGRYFGRRRDHGRSDAVLIAYACARRLLGRVWPEATPACATAFSVD